MNKNAETQTEYMTVAEMRAYLNISQASAYDLTHRKDFPTCRFGGSIRIPRQAFLAWVGMKTHISAELNRFMATA